MRRRARRRLVGAVVLALAAAVIVPMLLESEPRPLGEDVAVRIPPVDDGKFVNRLNDPAARNDNARPAARSEAPAKPARGPSAEAPGAASGAATPKDGAADGREGGPKPKYDTSLNSAGASAAGQGTAKAPGVTDSGTAPASAASAGGSTPAPSEGVSSGATAASGTPAASTSSKGPAAASSSATTITKGPSAASSAATKPASPAPGNATKSAAGPAAAVGSAASASGRPEGPFAVQLAAFSDDKGANALAGRLKRAGYTAYTEPLKTSKGTLWRVRVGPYPNREAAAAARDKLKNEGQNGIVAAAH